ncbi:hypothetical protein [uncultured Chryseobacterium sp.]|uniref:hypothetical protein n=1 Tax=uncultured Chryseobacterium sp. TaxID=259322 RepID=UPI0025F2D0B8|nr:hypothetical protein [uncultured Chryseobacterium sp.]
MKTKTIMILGIISLWAFTACRCDLPSDEPENKDKNKETQELRYPDLKNDSLSIGK